MKKVSLLAFLLATATAGAASASGETLVPGCPKAFQGFGLKGNIGFGTGRAQRHSSARTRFFVNGLQQEGVFNDHFSKTDVGVAGVDGGIGVDYTHRFCNWALGIAFDANWSNAKGKERHANISRLIGDTTVSRAVFAHKVRLRNSLQLYARAGYVICGQVMPFVGLGWDNSRWGHRHGFNNLLADSTNLGSRRFGRHKRINSLLWKLGVDFLATKHCILGFEYTGTGAGRVKRHAAFNTPQVGTDVATLIPATTNHVKTSFRPQYNKFALTLKFIY